MNKDIGERQKNEFSGKKVIVVGTGISGIGAVKLLCEVGAQAVLYDGNDKLDKAEIESRLPEGRRRILYLAPWRIRF